MLTNRADDTFCALLEIRKVIGNFIQKPLLLQVRWKECVYVLLGFKGYTRTISEASVNWLPYMMFANKTEPCSCDTKRSVPSC